MKNKIYALALSLGIFSPLSCAMESRFYPANPNISSGFSLVPVQFNLATYSPACGFVPYGVSSGPANYGSSPCPAPYGPVACPGSCGLVPSGQNTYGSTQHRPALCPAPLPDTLLRPTNYGSITYTPNQQGGMSRIFGEKISTQNCIEYVNLKNDLATYNSLKEFKNMDNNTVVHTFVDFLGREYTNIRLKAAISRCGALDYCAYISKTWEDESETMYMFTDFQNQYNEAFKSNVKFQGTEAKTKIIHFVEDAILRPLYGKTLCMHYRDLISYLRYFYYSDEYGKPIMEAWKSFVLGEFNNSDFPVSLSKDKTARKNVRKFIDKLYIQRKTESKERIG